MKILGVIPARYQSSRFPGKPLIDINGQTMIQRVYNQCKKCSQLNDVVIATDDIRIFDHAKSIGAKVIMTSTEHINGTSRCTEVATLFPEYDIIINIQGDEPFISPIQISDLISVFDNPKAEIASMFKKISSLEQLDNPNTVKVVLDTDNKALYFSRFAIPYLRGIENNKRLENNNFYQHIGLYGFKSDILHKISTLSPSTLELCESLEQLRWIENGFSIFMKETFTETIAIDTPEDLEKILKTI